MNSDDLVEVALAILFLAVFGGIALVITTGLSATTFSNVVESIVVPVVMFLLFAAVFAGLGKALADAIS